jgi:hypothetical protein
MQRRNAPAVVVDHSRRQWRQLEAALGAARPTCGFLGDADDGDPPEEEGVGGGRSVTGRAPTGAGTAHGGESSWLRCSRRSPPTSLERHVAGAR